MQNLFTFLAILSAFAVTLSAPATHAKRVSIGNHTNSQDALIAREAKRCTQHFAKQERYHGIPEHLLAAIATTESGRRHKGLGMMLPWPWTANVEGKGYYFNDKSEAIAKIKALQAQGKKSIDVGCMQVNLKHHPDAFANLEQAFDPAYNVAYAARFLRMNYLDTGDWKKAASYYHSKTPARGEKYFSYVKNHWERLTKRLSNGRSLALASIDSVTPSTKSVYAREPKRYNSISVNGVESSVQKSDVLVIRPKTNSRAAVSSAPTPNKSNQPIDLKPTKHAGLQLSVSSEAGVNVVRNTRKPEAKVQNHSLTTGKHSVFIFQ